MLSEAKNLRIWPSSAIQRSFAEFTLSAAERVQDDEPF